MNAVAGVQVAIVFVWLGMVLGISFLEAPLKFRAPGITVPLGVGIGRLVFRALNAVEAVLALTLIVLGAMHPSVATLWLIAALCATLAVGSRALRPAMDRRVLRGQISDGVPRNGLHVWYIALEVVKAGLLITLGCVVLAC